MIYTKGNVTINNQILRIENTIINLANLGNASIIKFDRYSPFKGIKEWLQLLLVLVVVCNIWRNLMFIGDLYLFTIIPLVVYNLNEFRKTYYGLEVQAGGRGIILKSRDIEFLAKAQTAIMDAIDNTQEKYIINIENCEVNNGIINNGNRNKNEVKHVSK